MKDIGDIVLMKGIAGLYWMIIDIIPFENESGIMSENDIGYEISPFYPVEEATDFSPMVVFDREMTLYAKGGSLKAMRIEERAVDEILAQESQSKLKPVKVELTDKRKPKAKKKTNATNNKKEDVIKYNKLDSIDECLDALNDLNELHKAFGDESYLQLREIVTKRLKEIS